MRRTTKDECRAVFEGITDPAAEEYLEINSTKEGIVEYAMGGLNIYLIPEQIEFIFKKIEDYKNGYL